MEQQEHRRTLWAPNWSNGTEESAQLCQQVDPIPEDLMLLQSKAEKSATLEKTCRAWMLMQIIKARFSVLTTWELSNWKLKKNICLHFFYRSSCNFCTLRFFGSLHLQKLIFLFKKKSSGFRRALVLKTQFPQPSTPQTLSLETSRTSPIENDET